MKLSAPIVAAALLAGTTAFVIPVPAAVHPSSWLDAITVSRAPIDSSINIRTPRPDLPSLDDSSLHALETSVSALVEATVHLFSFHHHHPPTDNLTIWQLLQLSEHTTTFASLVSEYDSLVDLLNSTRANHTLFVPADSAFAKIPPGHEKPGKDVLEGFIRYHIVEGSVDARGLWYRNTLPTLLEEGMLGGEPQRLRVRFGLRGAVVNVHSRIIVGNVAAKNGIIHALDTILVPPTMVGKELSLIPSVFSTLLYAYQKTDFVSFIHHVPMEGSTIFAPTNRAFSRLGGRTNAFLFETERGRRILTAILKYGIVANTTLYSDAVYGRLGGVEEAGGRSTHYELRTLYDGKGLGVDLWRWGGWTRMRVNGENSVVFADGVAKNGVIHVVDRVPLPPCPRGEADGEGEEGEISVEDLVERFEGWMGGEEGGEKMQVVLGDL